VIVTLAACVEVNAGELWAYLQKEAVDKVNELGPQEATISSEELQLRRVHHDLVTLSSHDLFLARYLGRELFSTIRLVLICAGGTGGQVGVQVIADRDFDGKADGARTRVILAYEGHA